MIPLSAAAPATPAAAPAEPAPEASAQPVASAYGVEASVAAPIETGTTLESSSSESSAEPKDSATEPSPQLAPPRTRPLELPAIPEEFSLSLTDLRVAAPQVAVVSQSTPTRTPSRAGRDETGSFSSDAPESLEGVTIGRYVVRNRLAQGGMATVYLAQLTGDEGFARWVAIKIIHSHLARDPRFVAMFLDEARIASRIGHPNICAVLDYGTGPPPHLVMEHLHGEPLSALGRAAAGKGGVPVWLALRSLADAARGLHAAHELRGADGKLLEVVHRDVSMQNIFILYDGVTKVLDFGVAKARNRISATETGELKGKIAYMPPDVLGGAPVDRRTDVWGLGVVLWELIAHRRLFRGANEATTVHNVLHRKVPALSSLRTDVPAGLDAIVQRALERDPARRFQTAAELAEQLEKLLHQESVPAGAPQIAAWMADVLGDRKTTRERILRTLTQSMDAAADRELTALHEDDLVEGSDAHDLAFSTTSRPRSWAPWIGLVAVAVAVAVAAIGIGWFAGGSGDVPGLDPTATSRPAVPPTTTAIVPATSPTDTVPTDTVPTDTVPTDTVPTDTVPTDTVPTDTVRTGTVPTDTMPTDTVRTPPATSTLRHTTVATGTLNLMALPPAEVFLGSRSLGRTPLVNVSLPAGRHRLTLRAVAGGAERTTTIVIRAGERTLESVR